MAAGYFEHRMTSTATFSLYIRGYPSNRNYYVATGLEDALQEIENLQFLPRDLEYLGDSELFSEPFLDYLETFRFSGTVHALPEGSIFFAEEPILEVTAPLIEAQIIETFLINTIGLQTMIASKASRCIHAADGRPLIDFSLRRTQGCEAGLKVARSTYIAGFSATSNVLAGQKYGIPISGTMAHSFVQAFGSDADAFAAFAEVFPHNSVFLIDTYDVIDGAREVVKVAREMKKKGLTPVGVRLDSGDMVQSSRQVRTILDQAGLENVNIFASSGFDEYKIKQVLEDGARIDAFGVGTKVGVSADAPYSDIVYKIVRYNGRDVRKLSSKKVTLAGEKQVFRRKADDGTFLKDYIGVRSETIDGCSSLLEPVMRDGHILKPQPSLDQIRTDFQGNFSALPESIKALDAQDTYPVNVTERLKKLQKND
jgi:nicotinate phosphoribosyltransferase